MRIVIVRKIFPARAEAPPRLVFENLSLEVCDGEVCAVLGASGTGKTSLLQIAAGLDREFAGAVSGRPEPVGYLFQAPRLLPWRTARQNLELVLGGDAGGADAWLARVGLAGEGDVYPQRLSLGMARRVALARALAVRPKLLLLDEPTSSLDEATAREVHGLLAEEIVRLRPTTLLVTHDWHEATALADRVVVLDGSPARIVSDQRVQKARAAE
ncbi:MAG TPA: ATP-binding cassette domain-containing protein [Microvirga sp.]|nr:ATP-binding cassette domain-containing protein [Microvirga sp.]